MFRGTASPVHIEMATPGMSMARTTRETKTSTPGIPLHVTRSSVEKGKQVVLPGGLTDISEISSEGGHERYFNFYNYQV